MEKPPLTRRQFLVKSASLLALLGAGTGLLLQRGSLTANPRTLPKPVSNISPAPADASLVVIQLSGGNDGINTVIPYGLGTYYDARPTLGYKEKEVLPIDQQLAFHPSLKNLHQLYQSGRLAVINGVGYPNPNRSHFRSMEIWQTAAPDRIRTTGWLGRYADASLAGDTNPLAVVQIGSLQSKALYAEHRSVPVIGAVDSYYLWNPGMPKWEQNRIAQAFLELYGTRPGSGVLSVIGQRGQDAYHSVNALHALHVKGAGSVRYPDSQFGSDLQLTANLLSSDAGSKVIYLETGGFDDHASEKDQHARVLGNVDEGLYAFWQDAASRGFADKVAIMIFSEFGRRVKENSSGGTDHGTAAPMFVLGGRVKGGLYGQYPSLTNLDQGDLKYEVDFRSVYTTLVEDWLHGDAQTAVGGKFEKMNFLV